MISIFYQNSGKGGSIKDPEIVRLTCRGRGEAGMYLGCFEAVHE